MHRDDAGERLERMWRYVRERHPRSVRGIEEAQETNPEAFARFAGTFLKWGEQALGDRALPTMLSAFERFTLDANMSQGRYERDGHYEFSSFAECYEHIYSRTDMMTHYLWGVFLANALWAHHLELLCFYDEHFLSRLAPETTFVEFGSGHGGWGAWALHRVPHSTLQGYDISPTAIDIATRVAQSGAFADRASYTERDALSLGVLPAASCDAVVSGFLLEHLEQPQKLFEVSAHVLRDHGWAFMTAALTAAQNDHIYEFFRESEPILMAEAAGLRVRAILSSNPRRALPKARYRARTMALVMQKRVTDTW